MAVRFSGNIGAGQEGERRLWQRVILRAILDAFVVPPTGVNGRAKEALFFLLQDSAFEGVCFLADWDVHYLREGVQRLIAQGVTPTSTSELRRLFSGLH